MDLGAVASAARRVGADARSDTGSGAQRIALSPRLLLPLIQGPALGNAALAELARDVRAQLVRGGSTVTLILPPGAVSDTQPARIDTGARQVAIPGPLRDALLAQLSQPTQVLQASQVSQASQLAPSATVLDRGAAVSVVASAASSGVAASTLVADEAARAWVVSAQTQAAATQLLSAQAAIGAGAARELLRALAPRATSATRDQALPAVGFDQPVADPAVLEPTPVAAINAIAQRLQQRLERSGLFFESHLSQWTRGARSSDELRAELVQLNRAALWTGTGTGAGAGDPGAQRVAAQLAMLDHGGLVLTGPAWAGQRMQLVIEREPQKSDGHADAPAPADMPHVFNATLALDLPQLGRVQVELRLAGTAIATTVHAEHAEQLRAGLAQLADQFRARGLTPVAARAMSLEVPE